jgi:hypothetical protein
MNKNDDPWATYSQTVLYFSAEPQVFVDLRKPVSVAKRDALAEIGLANEFSILTAFNPHGKNITEDENERRRLELERELVESGFHFVQVDACSPDTSHCECSYAVSAPLDRVIEMADHWDQLAVFWFDGSSFWIVGGELRKGERSKLPT